MTKPKSVTQVNHINNTPTKKQLKCGKIKQTGVAVATLKKKVLMTKEQEASIADTISCVIKSKLGAKLITKTPPQQVKSDNVPKKKPDGKSSKKLLFKDLNPKETTAKKTAVAKTKPKKDFEQSVFKKFDKKVVKAINKSRSPTDRCTKQDNNADIKDIKAETKQKVKVDLKEKDKDKKPEALDKLPAGKDKQVKDEEEEEMDKTPNDKKDTEKLIKEKKTDCTDKLSKDKNSSSPKSKKSTKQVKDTKEQARNTKGTVPTNKKTLVKKITMKPKGNIKKPITVKVKKVNLKRLTGTKKKIPEKKDKEESKDNKTKPNSKFAIKEEQLDEVIAEILKSSANVDITPKKIKAKPRRAEIKKERKVPKLSTSVLKKKLKAKLKKSSPLATLKTTVVVKKPNQKPKLVSKPIQQVKPRKLLSIWNGPKRHRVASLNALAKVHCLYENESRGHLDQLDLLLKREPSEDCKDKVGKHEDRSDKKSVKDERDTPSPQPTRTLRSVPGLRVIGKMWDMHDTSSSDEEYHRVIAASRLEKPKKPKVVKPLVQSQATPEKRAASISYKKKPAIVKRRKKDEIVMDLKDMVVRKRMASLNASAILAASYSVEKRVRSKYDSDSYDDTETSSEEEFSSEEDPRIEELKKLEDIKKEGKMDRKLMAVPNKKVAVILNQDTDVTFTGVYMNSTTRSTHHEGYCRIAGMQYRISATSHTQTAATAVATETILQSTTTTTHENENVDAAAPVKSYTPLDALSNMQPPANAVQSHHHLPPPPPLPPAAHHHVIPAHGGPSAAAAASTELVRRHGCSSAFSAPPQGHHHLPPDHGYVQGYYQPAGPLISVHGHSQPPPPTLSSKSVPLADASPISTSPLLQPPPPSSAGDSSDSEVIITSVTTAKEALASHHQVHQGPPAAYRLNHHYQPPPPPHNSYPTYGPYPPQYYTAPPPPGPPYSHHDMCYTSFPPPHKYMFRRYLAPPAPPYYQTASPDIYGQPQNPTNQQVVTATSSASGSYQSSSTGPPPPTLMEPYPGPPPTLIETYPPPSHYYQGYGPAPPCYTHSPPARPLNYINATYQTCPCPMQSCPKNVHTGPLAGDSKRSNIAIAKESIPLPPVALALPLEPASATGPPSPARGSAGMPPPPSPAGATYQPPPPKQETPEPATERISQHVEKRRKARVGKAMVRNTIAQNHNTMLLMCQMPQSQTTILETVKREVESPKEDVVVTEGTQKKLIASEFVQKDVVIQKTQVLNNTPVLNCENSIIKCEIDIEAVEKIQKNENQLIPTALPLSPPVPPTVVITPPPPDLATQVPAIEIIEDLLLPCQKTVAENVKVKNMKRKLSVTKEEAPAVTDTLPSKRPKLDVSSKTNGSYKDLIKKTQNVVKINNGKRKLITGSRTISGVLIRLKKNYKRKLSATLSSKEEHFKRMKSAKPLTDSNVPQNAKTAAVKEAKAIVDPELIENKEPTNVGGKKMLKKQQHQQHQPQQQQPPTSSHGVAKTKKLLANGVAQPIAMCHTSSSISNGSCDNNAKLSNLERTIESVVSNLRVCAPRVQENGALRTEKRALSITVEKVDSDCKRVTTTTVVAANGAKRAANKVTKVKKLVAAAPVRRSKSKESKVPQLIAKVPRRSAQLRWSNGWQWHGAPFDGKVFLNSDEATVIRKCYPAMVHEEGDIIEPRDCVLLKAGQRKNELPFVAKIAALWENPDDGEMMMSLLWYYRPEHTEQGRRPIDQPDEVFASRHKDSNSVACIEDKCYVLTYNEYCRYRKDLRRLEACVEDTGLNIPLPDRYPRLHRQPPSTMSTSSDLVFFCRKVYDFRQKRIIKNPS